MQPQALGQGFGLLVSHYASTAWCFLLSSFNVKSNSYIHDTNDGFQKAP